MNFTPLSSCWKIQINSSIVDLHCFPPSVEETIIYSLRSDLHKKRGIFVELFVIFINGLLAGYESIFIELFEKNREFSTKISYQIALQRKKTEKTLSLFNSNFQRSKRSTHTQNVRYTSLKYVQSQLIKHYEQFIPGSFPTAINSAHCNLR